MEKIEIADEDIHEEDFSPEELESDDVDWKSKALELKGLAKRRATQLKKAKIALQAAESLSKVESTKKSGDFDYGQLAYLNTKGIDVDTDIEFLQNEVKNTGKDLREVLGFKYVQEHLAANKEQRTTADAIPNSSPRSATTARTSVDYWIARGELPPLDQPELRREVVKERLKREQARSKFSDTPIVR